MTFTEISKLPLGTPLRYQLDNELSYIGILSKTEGGNFFFSPAGIMWLWGGWRLMNFERYSKISESEMVLYWMENA